MGAEDNNCTFADVHAYPFFIMTVVMTLSSFSSIDTSCSPTGAVTALCILDGAPRPAAGFPPTRGQDASCLLLLGKGLGLLDPLPHNGILAGHSPVEGALQLGAQRQLLKIGRLLLIQDDALLH